MFEKVKEYLEKLDFEIQSEEDGHDGTNFVTFIKNTPSTIEEVVLACGSAETDFTYEGFILFDDGQRVILTVEDGLPMTSIDDLKRHMTAFRNLTKFYQK